ncbi:MAG: addiction module toxin, HicA family [Candidatus Altiarchaeales archaeon]|nr:addiction module toxin, HicA family [Candidatus Altiarchaeales archaeon]MBD3416446.1 addiction module toxin, HicA family [Candidatus Altiarchaeales archaeon]
MASKLPIVSGKQAVKAFNKLGYAVIRRRSSHIRLEHESKKKITIPDHKTLGKGILRKLIRDAEITIEEFNKLLK